MTLGAIKKMVRRHYFIVSLCAALFILCAAAAFTDIRFFINPDATSYFTIAQKYAHFQLKHAVNGYWGPLLSWLLVPAVWLHIDLTSAARILDGLLAVIITAMAYLILVRRGVSRSVAYFTCVVVAITAGEWAVIGPVTPDLLLATLMTILVYHLSAFTMEPTRKRAVLLGLLGSLLYFSKAVGLYVFIVVVAVLAIYQWRSSGQSFKKVTGMYWPAAATLAVLCLPFMAAISLKYHMPTTGTAAGYNHRVYGPVGLGRQPMVYSGPLKPPNDTASSTWEDPTPLTQVYPAWSPLQSGSNLRFFKNSVIGSNLNTTFMFMNHSGLVVALGGLLLIVGSFQRYCRRDFAIMTLAAAVLALGYALVFTGDRYLYTLAVFSIIGAGLWAAQAEKKKLLDRRGLWLAGAITVFIVGLAAGQRIVYFYKNDVHDWRRWHQQAVSFAAGVPAGSNVISDTYNSYYACYELGLHCYGVLNTVPKTEAAPYYKALKQDGVTYYLNYHSRDDDSQLGQFAKAYFEKQSDVSGPGGLKTGVYKIK